MTEGVVDWLLNDNESWSRLREFEQCMKVVCNCLGVRMQDN